MWIIIHSLVWNGEISRADDLGFPFNLFSTFLSGGPIAKTAEPKEDDISLPELPLENRVTDPISMLSEISLNDLYNFLFDPETAAANLFISAGFVIIITKFSYFDFHFSKY